MADLVDVRTMFGPLPAASVDLQLSTLLEGMQKHGIARACTLSTFGLLLDPAAGNAETRAICQQNPSLIPMAVANPIRPNAAAGIEQLRGQGFAMVTFHRDVQHWPPAFLPFYDCLESASSIGLPAMVTVTRAGEITELLNAPEIQTPLVLSGVTGEMVSEASAALRRRRNWLVETSHLLGAGAFAAMAAGGGHERLLFASGAPSSPVGAALIALEIAGLQPDARTAVLGGNARSYLGISL